VYKRFVYILLAKEMEKENTKRLKSLHAEIAELRTRVSNLKQVKDEKALATQAPEKKTVAKEVNFKTAHELIGHYGKVYALDWRSDSVHLASASQDGKLLVWDGVTTNKRHFINLRSSWVMTCAYAPSGQMIACGGLDNLCSIYMLPANFGLPETNDRPKHELAFHQGYLSCCKFLSDQQILTSSGDGQCILWDITRQDVLRTFESHEADVMSISVCDADPNIFVSGSCDRTARVWDQRQERSIYTFVGHVTDINSVKWIPGTKTFASGSDDSTVRLYDLRAYSQINMYASSKVACGVTSVDFSASGKYLFCGYDDDPFGGVWSTIESTLLQPLKKKQEKVRISCLGVPKTGYCLATGTWNNLLTIWTTG